MAPDDKNELQLFEDIVRGQEMRDEGIVSHGAALREFEEEIRVRYVERGFVAIPEEDLEALEEKANEHWPYLGKVASVSGRLEIIFDEDKAVLTEMFRNIAVPDASDETVHVLNDEIYYIDVDKAKIRSGGVVLDVVVSDDGNLEDVRVGYIFYLLSDTNEDLPLFVQPDMLDSHTYDTPTPAEARARLEYNWPSQLEAIDSIIRMKEAVPHRLVLIAETLNEELKDAGFRELAELYVNEELDLDGDMPYMTLVRDRVDSLDDIDDDNGMWSSLEIEGALTLFVKSPEVRFTAVTDEIEKEPEAYLFGMTFNDEDGDKPEMVAIPAKNIDRFFSTRASVSLAQRAIETMDRALEADMQVMLESKNGVRFVEVEVDTSDIPEYVEQLEMIEEAMGRIKKLSDEYLKHSFTTYEDAKKDADTLLEKVTEHLNGTFFSQGAHRVKAMGERIKIANLRHNLHFDEEQNVLMHGADKENPIIELSFGDQIVGTTSQLYAVAESTSVAVDGDDSIVFYTPRVVMGVVTSEGVGLAINSQPSLSQLTVRNQAGVPLDSSSDIQFVILDQYRARLEAIQRAKKAYGDGSPLVQRIRELEEALSHESPDDFVQLDPAVIPGFITDLAEARQREEPIEPVISVLEAMLGDRVILAAGNMYQRTHEGEYTLDDERTGRLQSLRVVDIQAQHGSDEIMLFTASPFGEKYGYISVSSIVEFRF